MSQDQEYLKQVAQKVNEMILKIQQDQGSIKTAKLVSFFVIKGGLRNDIPLLLSLLPKLVKILFDFGEIPLCIQLLQEAITCQPEDAFLKSRLKKLQELEKYNTVKPKVQKKSTQEESSYDIAAEISNIDQMIHAQQKLPSAVDENHITNQQTIISSTSNISTSMDKNEITLAPTAHTTTTTLDQTIISPKEYLETTIQPLKSTPQLPPEIIQNYPGVALLSSRYEYQEILGEGGMGGVFLAKDKQLDRHVAIKFMNSLCISNHEVAERFIREARTQAVVNHPGIVAIYDVGTEGNPFIVMEYVEGKTLRHIIKHEGGCSLKESKRLMIMIAEALEYAHLKKIIHRDVKPDNIILDQFGKTRLLDFGLAKQEQTPTMTINAQVMGTPYYMSPEQIHGKEVGAPTDIYAWGIMFYQMVTGVVPFHKGDILYHHVNTPPTPPKQLAMDIPDALNDLILKAIKKKEEERYQNFTEVLKDLRTIA